MSSTDRFQEVWTRVREAERRSKRPPGSVKVVGAAKAQPARALESYAAWCASVGVPCLLGENYLQEHELRPKLQGAEWHFIGHLQRNKVKDAIGSFRLIESLDSDRLADQINKICLERSVQQDVLLQVNVSKDEAKHGIEPAQVSEMLREASSRWPALRIRGLMAITRLYDNPEDARNDFAELRKLAERSPFAEQPCLSMGMSADFEIAIEEGATLVRIGTAMFGERS
jgi:pyridoxal phosphate enzyme (YggS family)